MTYTKTTWVDRLVETPNLYNKSDESNDEVTLTPSPGTVTVEGTTISASKMNKIEQGIGDVDAAVAAHVADLIKHGGYALATGPANAYVVTLAPAATAYVEGMLIVFRCPAANTGASTINVNGLGAKNILNSKGAALTANKFVVGGVYSLRYNSTAFILQGEGGEYGTAVVADVLTGKTIGTDAGLVNGTIPIRGVVAATAQDISGTTIRSRAPVGYYDGTASSLVTITDVDFIAANILNTANIFGLQGIAQSREYATGTIMGVNHGINPSYTTIGISGSPVNNVFYSDITVIGLDFLASVIVLKWSSGGSAYATVYNANSPFISDYYIYRSMNSNYVKFGARGYVNSTGFQLPAYDTMITWYAYK